MTEIKYIGHCNCGGTRNNKYQVGQYILYFIPKHKLYHIKEGNSYLTKYQPVKNLCDHLKQLGFSVSKEYLSTALSLTS